MTKPIIPQARYGRWTVIHREETKPTSYRKYLCRCDCGTIRIVSATRLNIGLSRSCGCSTKDNPHHLTHGMANTSEYSIWTHMLQRCHNPRDAAYADYGGRGIEVCSVWRSSFQSFYNDMGNRPSRQHTIERRNNDCGYSPDNCYWATSHQQTRNKRNNTWLTVDGITLCLSDWALKSGINHRTISWRLKAGWSEQDAITIPLHLTKSKNTKRPAVTRK